MPNTRAVNGGSGGRASAGSFRGIMTGEEPRESLESMERSWVSSQAGLQRSFPWCGQPESQETRQTSACLV